MTTVKRFADYIYTVPAGAADHFSYGVNFYKLMWVFFVGSFAGFIVESIWCVLRQGDLQCRASFVYGPFNLVYGVGAMVLYLSLYSIDRHNLPAVFLVSFIAGTVVEYACSFFQEKMFGTVSWNYEGLPLNINGRVCLLYSVFWGALGILWSAVISPLCDRLLANIPVQVGKAAAWVILAFFIFDGAVTLAAMVRWMGRCGGIDAFGAFGRLLDSRFPDVRMEKLYPNMIFLENIDPAPLRGVWTLLHRRG